MNIVTKIVRFIKRKIAHIIFFFITDNFDEFIGNSATLQNVQNLQRIVSEGVNKDRFQIKENQSALQETQKEVKQHQSALQETQKEVKHHQSALQETQKEVKHHQSALQTISVDIHATQGRIDEIQKFATAINVDVTKEREALQAVRKEKELLSEFIEYSPKKLELKNKLKNVPDIDYVAFENKHRGSQELIKKRQRVFLPFFKQCKSVLDIGCGRGEFLELLKEAGIHATGIDIDEGMIDVCHKKGLNVFRSDIMTFLDDLGTNEIDGVFCSQVIEHFPVRHLQWILYVLAQKIRPRGIALFETINPRCLPAMQHFYMDSSHVQPLDLEAFLFMAENYQFCHNAALLSSPVDPKLSDTTQDLQYIDQYRDWALIINKK